MVKLKTHSSLLQTERECYFCKRPYVERHHIFYGRGRRTLSDVDGCWCWLCHEHHEGTTGVHGNNFKLNKYLKQEAERKWLKYYGKTVEDFIKRYNINYLEEDDESSDFDGETD